MNKVRIWNMIKHVLKHKNELLHKIMEKKVSSKKEIEDNNIIDVLNTWYVIQANNLQ